jgi:hypothetical protein
MRSCYKRKIIDVVELSLSSVFQSKKLPLMQLYPRITILLPEAKRPTFGYLQINGGQQELYHLDHSTSNHKTLLHGESLVLEQ